MNVRRLAAVDMYGSTGSVRRRRTILAEYVVAVLVLVGFGAWVLSASSGAGGRVFGAWIAGAGLNYVPLAAYALRLRRPGALNSDLAGVDTGSELRRYSVL